LDTGADSFGLPFGRVGSLEHETPLVELLLQDVLGDHLGFVLSNERGGEVAAHGVFHDLIILAAAEQNADAGVFVRAFAVAVERLKIEGELAQVLGLKAHRLQLERHQTLQVTVVKEQIKFKILIAHLHADFFADKGEAVAKFHEEFAQIAQQAGLQIGLAVTLGQVEVLRVSCRTGQFARRPRF
jgi:hypothetical protein